MTISREDLLEKITELENLGRNLLELARAKRLGPVYERRELIAELAAQLQRPGNNVILVGEPGTGKNAVVEGLANWMVRREVDLSFKALIECTHITFQSQCMYAHEFETKIQLTVDKVREHRALLFFDQINLAIGAGSVAGFEERNLANLLNPYLARNEMTIVGATTPDGYKAMVKNNPSFVNRFIYLEVPPLSAAETLAIMQNLKGKFESKYQVEIDPATFPTLVDLAERYQPERFFPGKAFEAFKEVIGAKSIRDPNQQIMPADVYRIFKIRTGLPDFVIYRERNIARQNIRQYFRERLFGQDDAIEEIVDIILTYKAELHDPQRPVAVFLFAGPTGVGKTYLARLLAAYLFGSEAKLLRFDMSEYSASDSAQRLLLGKGEERRGKLVEEMLVHPFAVILLDEIEKAHPQVFNLLLSAIGEGRLTDEKGRTVSFCNSIIIMTSNLGAELYGRKLIGMGTRAEEVRDKDLLQEIKDYFRPEFINRLTKIVFFKPLSRETALTIAMQGVNHLAARKGMTLRQLQIKVTSAALDYLVDKGFSPEFGARPMVRAIERYVGYPLAEAIAAGKISCHDTIRVKLNKGQLKLSGSSGGKSLNPAN